MKSISMGIGVVLIWLTSSIAIAADAPALQAQFGDQGLKSITFGGTELLAGGQIDLRQRNAETGAANAPLAEPKITFDASANTLLETYEWGTIACAYRVDGNRIFMDVTVHNTAKDSIRIFDIALLHLKLPGWTGQKKWEDRWPQPMVLNDDPQVIEADGDNGIMLYCSEDVDRPMGMHILADKDPDDYALTLREDGPPLSEGIGANDTRVFNLSVRFGPKDASSIDMAQDIYKRFAEQYPMELKWDDHRPMGYCALASAEASSKTNPRGWFGDKNFDISTDAGKAEFPVRLMKYADTSIHFAKDMNAQGVIVWDMEGQEMPHMVSYIGDPRLMEQMAPEMKPIADAFMKKFTDAGLRIGVTIRPSHVVHSPGARIPYEHLQAADPVEEISEKIDYAIKRWGCSVFYVDSTVMWLIEPDGKLSMKVMPAEYFHILHDRFPNVLLIPEQSTTRTWAYCACYHELQQGYPSTPASVRACYPTSFSLLRVVDAPMQLIADKHKYLVGGVAAGDVIFFRAWWDDADYDSQIKQIYTEAKGQVK